jgi:hypothetical protein
MVSPRILGILGIVVTMLMTTLAMATEPVFTSPRGFSITPPDGWTVASKETISQMAGVAREQLSKLGNINFDRVAVVLFNPADAVASENINVVVSPGRMPIEDSDAEQKMADALRGAYGKMGVTITRLSVTRKTFGSHKALVADVDWNTAGMQIRQWQVALASTGQSFIVTCTAPPPSFDSATPTFSKAIESMKYAEPEAAFFGSGLPTWARGALIGAAIGALYGLYKLVASFKKTA